MARVRVRVGVGSVAVIAAGLLGCSSGSGSSSGALDGAAPVDGSMGRGGMDAGGTEAGPGASSEAGGDDGGSACPLPFVTNPTTCSNIDLVGQPIVPACTTSPAPVGTGGSVESGRYVLHSIELFATGDCPPPGLDTGQAVWIVCGSDWAAVNQFPGTDGGPSLRQFDVTADMDASTLTLDIMCPPQASGAALVHYQYSATPGHLSLIYMTSAATNGLEYTFTEQDDFVLQ